MSSGTWSDNTTGYTTQGNWIGVASSSTVVKNHKNRNFIKLLFL